MNAEVTSYIETPGGMRGETVGVWWHAVVSVPEGYQIVGTGVKASHHHG